MRSLKKDIIINAPLEIVFARMDDLSKTGMHMSKNSMMMMGRLHKSAKGNIIMLE